MQILLDTSLLYALNDAAIITMAERLGLERIATFDHRDFSLVRPQHCAAFELLP